MKNNLLLVLILIPVFSICQNLTNTSIITITKTWGQQPSGYTYPMDISVPSGTPPINGFPICILLHGNGQTGSSILTQYQSILNCHALIAPTGYMNSWDICAENSEAPDMDMILDLIDSLQNYSNININQIRILGFSNGAGLANRIFIENNDPRIDIVCAVVSQLNEPQYHLGDYYQPNGSSNSSSSYCGYDNVIVPISGRKYLSICNDNDPIIPYLGGTSIVGVDFLNAQDATFIVAQSQGYSGTQIIGPGNPIGSPLIFEYSYLSGDVVHLRGNAGHSTNSTQQDYIKDFFSDCEVSLGINEIIIDETEVYPNPVRSFINIKRTSDSPSVLQIFNTIGELVLKKEVNDKKIYLDLTYLSNGIYVLRLDNQAIKLIKEK